MGGVNTSNAASGIRDFHLIGFSDRSIARSYRHLSARQNSTRMFNAGFCRSRKQPAEPSRPEIAAASYIPMIAISFTVPLTPAIFAASVAFPVARSTL
jgi:hypothetical protein